MKSRRRFVLRLLPLAGAAALARLAAAQEQPALAESDPIAATLGFRLDTAKVDQSRFPKHRVQQRCGNCVYFTRSDTARARCDLFNKTVPAEGWCSGYSRRG